MLTLLKKTTLTARRPYNGHYDSDGKWNRGSESQFTFKASVQPVNPKELQTLPSAFKSTQGWVFYTKTKLNVLDEDSGEDGDIVEVDGKDYKVVRSEYWRDLSVSHYRVVALKIEKTA